MTQQNQTAKIKLLFRQQSPRCCAFWSFQSSPSTGENGRSPVTISQASWPKLSFPMQPWGQAFCSPGSSLGTFEKNPSHDWAEVTFQQEHGTGLSLFSAICAV